MTGQGSTKRSTVRYFTAAFAVTGGGLALAALVGWRYTNSPVGALTFFVICALLAVLEISLSFDNAIVNANKLKSMRPEWQRRFLTWGILIAVFGMRIVFPILIVVVAAGIGPVDAVVLAVTSPEKYSRLLHDAHLPISAFGGTFLLMVGLNYFFDHEKDTHWMHWLEERMARSATIKGIEIAIVLLVAVGFSRLLGHADRPVFIQASMFGLLTYLCVEVASEIIDSRGKAPRAIAGGGFGAFLYLEVLDASFSFDGVIGAFALSQNIFIIAIGLGIGAMYVRSMTIMLVQRGTLSEYRFLEHGAFYAIIVLAVVMYMQSLIHIPEVITGLAGGSLIAIAFWSSIRWRKKNGQEG